MAKRSLLQGLQVRAAALISPFTDNSRVVTFCLFGYAVLLVPILVGVKWPQDLFQDSVEAYAWGQQFLGGYGRHPPMTGWIGIACSRRPTGPPICFPTLWSRFR